MMTTQFEQQNSIYDNSASSTSSQANPEAEFYYSALSSDSRLVHRTGPTPWTKLWTQVWTTLWKKPTGPEAQYESKDLHLELWKSLGPKVCDFLDSVGDFWTAIDVVREVEPEDTDSVVLVLWIRVALEKVFANDTHAAAHGCVDLLKQSGINIKVKFLESVSTWSAGPKLLGPVGSELIVDFCGPFTPVLGLCIAAQATPHVEGTGGLYIAEGGDSKKVLLLTARHVLFPPNEGPNVTYTYTNNGAPCRNVLLLGTKAFDNLIESINTKIKGLSRKAEIYNQRIEESQESEAKSEALKYGIDMARQKTLWQEILDQGKEQMRVFDVFRNDVTKKWSQPSQRILGHIVHSPPITRDTGAEGFTEDYALVELDSSKFKDAFRGNVIDLGTKIPDHVFIRKMYGFTKSNTSVKFRYPYDDRLLKLQGLIQEDQMHNPDTLDNNNEPCLMVIKNGNATGVTIGRANGLFSFVREYFLNGTHQTSREWAILPYDTDRKSGAFSARGDSGSIVADGRGRIGGLITGGAGNTESVDVTYATPLFWLLPRIKANGFPNAHLNPVME